MSHLYKRLTNNTTIRSRGLHPWCGWSNAFSDEEVAKICELGKSKPLDTGYTVRSFENQIEPTTVDARKSYVNFHYFNNENSWIFERLNFIIESVNSDYYNFDVNGYDMFQYTEYRDTDNGHYDRHIDSFVGELPPTQYEQRKLSLTLLLSEPETEFEGGEFQFDYKTDNGNATVNLTKGSVIIFPSFFNHRVTKVTKGIRKSLVVWVLGPHFR